VLGGGLPRDRIYLVRGEPGTGKTTLALQFLLAGSAAGERCIYITLSETRAEIEATARSHGWSLREIVIIEMSALEQTVVLEQDNTIFASSEVQLQETTRRLLDHVQNSEPHRLVIDSLAELRLLAQSPLRYRRQILGFKQQLSGISSTVLLLDDCAGEPGDLQLQSRRTAYSSSSRSRCRTVKIAAACAW
jgi:circadian clock protein KaiC